MVSQNAEELRPPQWQMPDMKMARGMLKLEKQSKSVLQSNQNVKWLSTEHFSFT